MPSNFFFPGDELMEVARARAADYASALPFPHIVLDDFLPGDVIDGLLAEFPGPREAPWQRFDASEEVKLALARDATMGAFTRLVLAQFNSATFVDFLEMLTGITGLIPDPHFVGGGLHQIQRNGFLKVHADFNFHERLRLDRRLNVLMYLNNDWQEEYGGHLELWNRDMSECQQSVLPIANRCVIFSTTDFAYHGHPNPLKCPDGRTRKSLAFYYYTNGRPANEASDIHTTLFRDRPSRDQEVWIRTRSIARQLLPPIVLDAGRSVRRRLGH